MAAGALVPWLLILELCVMAILARVISYPFYRLKMPRIVGDIIAGLMLGPTIWGQSYSTMFPDSNYETIKIIGYIGLMLSSISAGADFDIRQLDGQKIRVLLFSLCNIAIPFGLSFVLSTILPSNTNWVPEGSISLAVTLYSACAQAGTSLPMTFLILSDLNRNDDLARYIIGCSTCATVILFTLVSIADTYSNPLILFGSQMILFRLGMMLIIMIILFCIHKFWMWGIARSEPRSWFRRPTTDMNLGILSLGFFTAVASERLGYTFILGAFLTGAVLPFNSIVRKNFMPLVKWGARSLWLPFFFLAIGMKFDLRTIEVADIGYIILYVVWGFAMKLPLLLYAKYILRKNWMDSAFIYSLMNCRGFNTLVIAQAALSAKQFGPALYVSSVLLSILSSAVAGPLCRLFMNADNIIQSDIPLTQFNTKAVEIIVNDTNAVGQFNTKLKIIAETPEEAKELEKSNLVFAHNQQGNMLELLHEVLRRLPLPALHMQTAGENALNPISQANLAVITGQDALNPISNRNNTEV